MLYQFKSEVAAEITMLQGNAEELLAIIGKPVAAQGIITVEQMPAAVAALRAAIRQRETEPAKADPAPDEAGNAVDEQEEKVPLRNRAAPFIRMLERSHDADKAVTWGT